MDNISLKALAKINLGLDVTGKREDGYHDVRMIMQSIHLYDRVEIKKTRSPKIRVEVNLYYLPVDENNLVYKAAAIMKERYGIKEGVRITLQKFIPVAAGLGGGSSDAAAVLVGMNRMFKLGLKQEELMKVGAQIGADVPFCVMRGTALAEGIGEKLTALPPMPKCPVLIAKPGVSVSTAEVYQNLKLYDGMKHPDIDGMIEAIQSKDLNGIAAKMENILETVTIPRYPVIKEIKKIMMDNGALNAMMSGSGPSVFGLFREEKDIQAAYEALKASELVKNLYTSEIHHNRR
ncbi:MAG: 4-(cytidine 5'-diphospho)-2-C-methyl-D-erythritol kinase [Eubacterium sp.]|nr:4-(cytidine 5'-diphospho)-2-C-methyl-D-erythritol kinase [Eubacterium sp.]MBQ9023462.1 4-(cytidine 5'-diphospho)-2-C-methyl-D-erythritol kinase [Eubacterium sp.]